MLSFYVAVLAAGAIVAMVGLFKKASFRFYIADAICALLLAALPAMLTYLHVALLQSSAIMMAVCTCVCFLFPVFKSELAGALSQILAPNGTAMLSAPSQEQDAAPVRILHYQRASAASPADDLFEQLGTFGQQQVASETNRVTPMQVSTQDQMQAAMQALAQAPVLAPVQAFAQAVQIPVQPKALLEMDMASMMGMVEPPNDLPAQGSTEAVQDFAPSNSVEKKDVPPRLWTREELLNKLKEMEGGEIDEEQMLFGDLLKNHPSAPGVPKDSTDLSANDLLAAGLQMPQPDFRKPIPTDDVHEQEFDLNAALAQLNADAGQQADPADDASILPELTQQPAEDAGMREENSVLGNLDLNLFDSDILVPANGAYMQQANQEQTQPVADETMQVQPEQIMDMPLSEEMLSYVMVDPPPIKNPPSLDEIFSPFEGGESADNSAGFHERQDVAEIDPQEKKRDFSKEIGEIMTKLDAVEDIIRKKNIASPADPMEHYFKQNNYHFNDEPIALKAFLTQTGSIILRRYQLPRMDYPLLNHAASVRLFNDALHFAEENQLEQAEMLLKHLCLTSVDSELSNRSFFIAKEMLAKKKQFKELENLVLGMIAKEKNLLCAIKDSQTMFGQSY